MMLKVLDVDGAVRRVKGGWEATGDRGHTTGSGTSGSRRRGRRGGDDARLRHDRDVPAGVPPPSVGRPAGRAVWAVRQLHRYWYDGAVPDAAPTSARAYLGQPGVALEPRRMWPTGAATLGVPVSGKIAAGRGGGAGPGAGPAV